ncbi:unnamed protein product [Diatraea saccharalis]|uniref:MADF domain-containing protein n=1 Tax=Diatraea saccharalis TaxID=40085 RepID=A0A9N9RAA1_9NEOP|nr:unnamed protein product [Diatraea saccharalis]
MSMEHQFLDNDNKTNSDTENNPKLLSLANIKALKLFDTEFIEKYGSLPVLWDREHSDYNNKYIRYEALEQLLPILRKQEPKVTIYHVRRKINTLRSNYRKELKKYLLSKRVRSDGVEYYTYPERNWKFFALKRFLGSDIDLNNKLEECNYDEEIEFENFQDESCDVLEDENESVHEANVNFPKGNSTPSTDTPQLKRVKRESITIDEVNDVELKAVATNVVCKLKRMNEEQRCQAELLINKVLYHGLKGNLTSDTDLAEVEHR